MSPPNDGREKRSASTSSDRDAVPASFEDAVKRLSDIVQILERGDLPLEESLRLFEEGVALSRASQDKLDGAQKRVEELLGFERDGRARTKSFDTRGDSGD